MTSAAGLGSQLHTQWSRLERQADGLALTPDRGSNAGRLVVAGPDELLEVVAVRQLGPGIGEQDIARLDPGGRCVRAGLDDPNQQSVIGWLWSRFGWLIPKRRDRIAQGEQPTALPRLSPVLAAALLAARRTCVPEGA